jgi:hypothetical protein
MRPVKLIRLIPACASRESAPTAITRLHFGWCRSLRDAPRQCPPTSRPLARRLIATLTFAA